MIDGRNFFHQPIRNNVKTYNNISEVAIDHGDDYTPSCLLGYPYFKENSKLITTHLSKLQVLDADPKLIHQVN